MHWFVLSLAISSLAFLILIIFWKWDTEAGSRWVRERSGRRAKGVISVIPKSGGGWNISRGSIASGRGGRRGGRRAVRASHSSPSSLPPLHQVPQPCYTGLGPWPPDQEAGYTRVHCLPLLFSSGTPVTRIMLAHSKHWLKRERSREETKGGRESRKKQRFLFTLLSPICHFPLALAPTAPHPEDLPWSGPLLHPSLYLTHSSCPFLTL